MAEITKLLKRWSDGDLEARERVMPLVFEDIREIARRYLSREGESHTLQPTALVNELYLRLVDRRTVQWVNREHFFGAAADLIRYLLVDHARRRLTLKRGAGSVKVPFDEAPHLAQSTPEEILELHQALKELEAMDPRQHRVVMLRYFVGLTQKEVAEVLGVSRATVERDWVLARAWLKMVLGHTD